MTRKVGHIGPDSADISDEKILNASSLQQAVYLLPTTVRSYVVHNEISQVSEFNTCNLSAKECVSNQKCEIG